MHSIIYRKRFDEPNDVKDVLVPPTNAKPKTYKKLKTENF